MSNDRFKFRAWDKEEGKMWGDIGGPGFCDSGYLCFDMSLKEYEDGPYSCLGVELETDKSILMQCIGLKDETGKNLVFEGDIIEYDIPLESDKPLSRNIVEWCDFKSQWRLSRYSAPYYEGSRMKVIGNIYENPELLEKEA